MIKNATTADMKPMVEIVNQLNGEGYTESFSVLPTGLGSSGNNKVFGPMDISVVNYYRFEGASDPADNAIVYAIETKTGEKGTLVDAYGTYSDEKINRFMKDVEDIHKEDAETDTS